jgi:hypothetical protein
MASRATAVVSSYTGIGGRDWEDIWCGNTGGKHDDSQMA